MRNQSHYKPTAWSAGKRGWPSRDWFKFCAIGEGSDTSLLDQSQSDVGKTWAILITFDTSLNITQNIEINLNANPLN